jgi:hypothetical protein
MGCGTPNMELELHVLDDIGELDEPLFIEKAVVLESTNSNLLGTFLNVKFNDKGFWVLDLDNRDAIHGFDLDGNSLGYVGEVGDGPDKLLNLSGFMLDKNSLQTISTYGSEVLVTNFSFDGAINSKSKIPFNFYSTAKAGNGYFWIYSGYNKEAGKYRLKLISGDGILKEEFLENSFLGDLLPLLEPVFFEGGEDVLFRETLKPIIYELSKKGPVERYRFDFGSFQVPDKFWEMDAIQGFNLINTQGFANINFINETKDHLLVDILIQKEGQNKKEILVLTKSTNRWFKIKVEEARNGHFLTPIGLSGEYILFISYAPYLVRNRVGLNLGSAAQKSLVNLNEDSNSVILYAKIPL